MTTITTRTGKGSALTHEELDDNFTNLNTSKLETANVATVATSGDYGDLINKPTIPTHTSNLTNDSGFVTNSVTGNLSVSGNVVAGTVRSDNYQFANGTPLTTGGGGSFDNEFTANVNANNNQIQNLSQINFGATGGKLNSNELFLGNTASAFPKQVRIVQNENVGYLQVGNASVTGGFFKVSKFNSTDSALTVDTTNNRVGINNVTPTVALDVAGTIATTGNIDIGGNLNMSGRMFDTSGVFQLNAVGNIVLVPTGSTQVEGNLSATGKLTTGAVTYANADGTAGQVLTTYGNGVTYFSTVSGGGGDGSPGGSDSQIQYNNGGAFGGNAAMTFDDATGNIAFGNIVIGNTGTSGTVYNVITSKNPFLGNTTTQPSNARILIGSGRNGDWSVTTDVNGHARNARLVVMDDYVKTDTGVRSTELAVLSYANLNGATTYGASNVNSRMQAIASDLVVYGGNITATSTNIVRSAAVSTTVGLGANTGNANISHVNTQSTQIGIFPGSIVGNAVVMNLGVFNTGQVNTQIGLTFSLGGNANATTGNTYCIHNTDQGTHGVSTSAPARRAANYYFLRNDDNVAQNKLGSVRLFHEYRHAATVSSGTLTIDKLNGQVQYVDLTEAVTTLTFSNFVTSASDSVNTDYQTDTVTVILRQDGTGRAVTMPSGSAYKYAGGTNTVGTTANSVTMLSVTAIYNVSAAATEYLITISPEFA
jgi:hypothetical protein